MYVWLYAVKCMYVCMYVGHAVHGHLPYVFLQEFYYKCANHETAEDDTCPPLPMFRQNTYNITCPTCTEIWYVNSDCKSFHSLVWCVLQRATSWSLHGLVGHSSQAKALSYTCKHSCTVLVQIHTQLYCTSTNTYTAVLY